MIGPTVQLIEALRPYAFLIANVPGLDDGPNWHVVQKTIAALRDAVAAARQYLESSSSAAFRDLDRALTALDAAEGKK